MVYGAPLTRTHLQEAIFILKKDLNAWCWNARHCGMMEEISSWRERNRSWHCPSKTPGDHLTCTFKKQGAEQIHFYFSMQMAHIINKEMSAPVPDSLTGFCLESWVVGSKHSGFSGVISAITVHTPVAWVILAHARWRLREKLHFKALCTFKQDFWFLLVVF